MRVSILGAGPAGLYLAILLKRADPAHEVVVVERNPPGATFGFGVVFSEETLGRLRDADEPTHEAITDAFATWTTIDVHYRGEVIRSRGHGFSAIRAHGAARHPPAAGARARRRAALRGARSRRWPSCRRPTSWWAPTA